MVSEFSHQEDAALPGGLGPGPRPGGGGGPPLDGQHQVRRIEDDADLPRAQDGAPRDIPDARQQAAQGLDHDFLLVQQRVHQQPDPLLAQRQDDAGVRDHLAVRRTGRRQLLQQPGQRGDRQRLAGVTMVSLPSMVKMSSVETIRIVSTLSTGKA